MSNEEKKPQSAADLKGKSGITRLINATRYSMQGFKAAFQNEDAFREEVLLAVVLIPAALLLPVGAVEKVLLIGSVLMLMLTEILNTAVEAVVDRIGPELHPLSGRAKDLGSAAVFIATVLLIITWAFLALPAVWTLIAG
ncbi:MAG: Diacylglycerol kinase [Burkholderia sp.]|jgi:diacylglycerol kinase (ATP)